MKKNETNEVLTELQFYHHILKTFCYTDCRFRVSAGLFVKGVQGPIHDENKKKPSVNTLMSYDGPDVV